jgi:hypothetical protein
VHPSQEPGLLQRRPESLRQGNSQCLNVILKGLFTRSDKFALQASYNCKFTS